MFSNQLPQCLVYKTLQGLINEERLIHILYGLLLKQTLKKWLWILKKCLVSFLMVC